MPVNSQHLQLPNGVPWRFVAKSAVLVAEGFSYSRVAVHSSLVRSNQLLCCGGAVVGPSTVFYSEQGSVRSFSPGNVNASAKFTFN
jgi:hypothetical protein